MRIRALPDEQAGAGDEPVPARAGPEAQVDEMRASRERAAGVAALPRPSYQLAHVPAALAAAGASISAPSAVAGQLRAAPAAGVCAQSP